MYKIKVWVYVNNMIKKNFQLNKKTIYYKDFTKPLAKIGICNLIGNIEMVTYIQNLCLAHDTTIYEYRF